MNELNPTNSGTCSDGTCSAPTGASAETSAAVAPRAAHNHRARVASPPTDIHDSGEAIFLTIEVPGLSRENLELRIEDQVLSLEGEVKASAFELDSKLGLSEFARKVYRRSFQLPPEVDAQAIDAKLEQGILTVTLPKSEASKPRRIVIN